MFGAALEKARRGETLNAAESEAAITSLLQGGIDEAQIAEFLRLLHRRGETEDEVLGAARGLRRYMLPFDGGKDALDCCGTGGDHHGTYNVSTAVAFVLAGAGVKVAKHGNRAVSSKSGSSDILAALDVKIDAPAPIMKKALEEANICFLMAPIYHPAMRHVAAVRAALGHRSIFNLLGPLANPAQTPRQLVGVFAHNWLAPYARILRETGSHHVWVAHGRDGLDEITTTAESDLCILKEGELKSALLSPEMAGLPRTPLEALKGGDAATNARALLGVLDNAPGPYRDIVLLNAAAALCVAEKASALPEGIELAARSLASGAARDTLKAFIRISHG